MRKTITLDPDVEVLIRTVMKQRGITFKEASIPPFERASRDGGLLCRSRFRWVQRKMFAGIRHWNPLPIWKTKSSAGRSHCLEMAGAALEPRLTSAHDGCILGQKGRAMTYARIVVLPVLALAVSAGFPILGQSVVSTHAGVIYFFEGSVFNGDVRLEQKFGKFPDIPEGGEFRTEDGRAEVLLTPGVVLRMDNHTSIRLLSNKLSDAQVELLAGSAIFESGRPEPDTSAQLIYKNWHVRTRGAGAYRIDTEPQRVRVYKGQVEVKADGRPETVAMDGEVLPLADVLVPEQSAEAEADPFQNWAMSRSQAIAADNSIAADIIDDPSRVDAAGLDVGGFSYFPLTGYPSLGIGNPYGLSFWSPYQSTLWSTYPSWYRLGLGRPNWSLAVPSYSRPIYGTHPWRPGPGLSPGGATSHRFGVEPRPIGPRPGAPHGGFHGVGHR